MTLQSLRGCLASLRGRPDTEHEMSFNRLAFSVVILFYLFCEDAPKTTQILAGTYCLIAVLVFLHILRWPAINKSRRVIALCLDMGFLCAELHYGGEIASVFAPIFLWVILGNGFRFGVSWLHLGMAIGILGFLVVWGTTPFWRDQPHLSWGLFLGLIAIPGYAGTLIRKVHAAKQQAEQANRAKSMFLASVSHELRTPLNAIIGMGSLLERSPLSADQREMARTTTEAGHNLLNLIDGILDFSRIEAGKLKVEPETLAVAHLLAEIRRAVGQQAQDKNLRLAFHVTPRTPHFFVADPHLLKQLLLNLVSNAIKFTKSGRVVVALDGHTKEENGQFKLLIEVSDTGIGIPEGAQQQIFESFAQADATIINRFGGTGLGLAICKNIVELLEGEIGVRSRVGEGSTFWISLPLRQAPSMPEKVAASIVLLSDDASVLAGEFSAANITVLPVTTLSDAISILAPEDSSASQILVAAPASLGLSVDAFCNTLAVVDPRGSLKVILLLESPPEGLPEICMRQASLSVLPEKAAIGDIYSSILLASALSSPIHAPEAEAETEKKGLSILVADDNVINRRVVRRILESAGHQVTLVVDGEEALEMLENCEFHLALIDLNMPEIDGIEVAKLYELQSLGRHRVPLVALTADATPDAHRKSLEAGMVACLAKPITPSDLLSAVRLHSIRDDAASPKLSSLGTSAPLGDDIEAPVTLSQTAVTGLIELGGQEFFNSLVIEFLSDADSLVSDLSASAMSNNLMNFRSNAHALGSSGAHLGALALCGLCRKAQKVTPADLEANGDQIVAQISIELSSLRRALFANCRDRPPSYAA